VIKWIKKILPPSRRHFNKVIRKLEDRLVKYVEPIQKTQDKELRLYKKCISKLNEILFAVNSLSTHDITLLYEDLNELSRKTDMVITKLSTVENNTIELSKKSDMVVTKLSTVENNTIEKIWYSNDFERVAIEEFYNITKQVEFKEKFLNLIRGMEQEDIDTIVKILKRQECLYDTRGKCLDIFWQEEQEALRLLNEHFMGQIFKIAEDLFCYKGYLLPINHFEPSVFYDMHGLDCVAHIETTSTKDIIDVGGFIGDSILILSPLTMKKVYSFEAASENYALLGKTIALNNISNAVSENVALGAERGTITISSLGSCSSSIELPGRVFQGAVEVPVITLDDYVQEHGLDVGLIKVDIEGAEQSFLQGAMQTIKKQKPIMLLSIYHTPSDFFDIKPIIESWNLGYKFKVHKPVDYSVSREVLLIAEIRD
jgi:FkbM family methyltransferase